MSVATLEIARALWQDTRRAVVVAVDEVVQRGPPRDIWKKLPVGGLVSEMDIYIDMAVRRQLARCIPDVPVLSEELGFLVSADADEGSSLVALLDPVDGTRSLVAGTDAWYVSLAICDEGRPKLGLLYQPSTALVLDSEDPRRKEGPVTGIFAVGRAVMQRWPSLPERIARSGLEMKVIPHAAAKVASVIMGSCDGALFLLSQPSTFYAWDIAAAMAIAEASDVALLTLDGLPPAIDNPRQPLRWSWLCARDHSTWDELRRILPPLVG